MTKKLTGEYNKAEKLSAEDAKRVLDAGKRDWHIFKDDQNKTIRVDTSDPSVKIIVPDSRDVQAIRISEDAIIQALGQNYEVRLKVSGIKFEDQDIPVIDDFSWSTPIFNPVLGS